MENEAQTPRHGSKMPVVPAGETREQEFKAVLPETLGRKRDGAGMGG